MNPKDNNHEGDHRPDRIFTARRIVAMDGHEPEAFAVSAGLVTATGALGDLLARFPGAEQIDLDGALVLPGFNDAHCHTSQAALQRVRVDVSTARSVAEVLALLRARARHTPPGQWVVGQGLDEHAVAGVVDRAALDLVSTEHPILVIQYTFHRAVVNTTGLRLLGYASAGDAPAGGQLPTDPAGHPTGWLFERAWLDPWLPGRGPRSIAPAGALDAQLAALEQVHAELHSVGVTSYCDAIVTPVEEQLYRAALEQGRLPARVNMMLWHSYLPANGLPEHPDVQFLRFAGVKMMLDGALSGGTCLCSQPYPSATGLDNGLQILGDDEFGTLFRRASGTGARVAVHANGDAAIAKVIDQVAQLPPSTVDHRIEHCSLVTPELLRRCRTHRITPVPFGPFVLLFGQQILDFYGPERAQMICAHRAMLDAGLPVAGSSDYPIVPIQPLLAVQSMVTRTTRDGLAVGTSQRVEPLEAVWVYTAGSAHATAEQSFKGRLTPGRAADFIALSQDITTVDPEHIADVEVTSTWLGGECVWQHT
ncbi:MAG: amidohydrolase [Intrasporangium sp.]|uniref:amidohydrolase n=1 Tax=Intrasporangium sp. TaxID=1925024 RepID=UPI0026481122|nr:amidohydrolase [Intrasporangium sp.]MDN5795002.1 amidohydrolase [Intrasporangium sp.]